MHVSLTWVIPNPRDGCDVSTPPGALSDISGATLQLNRHNLEPRSLGKDEPVGSRMQAVASPCFWFRVEGDIYFHEAPGHYHAHSSASARTQTRSKPSGPTMSCHEHLGTYIPPSVSCVTDRSWTVTSDSCGCAYRFRIQVTARGIEHMLIFRLALSSRGPT